MEACKCENIIYATQSTNFDEEYIVTWEKHYRYKGDKRKGNENHNILQHCFV